MSRFTTLMKHYPFETNYEKFKLGYDTKLPGSEISEVKRYIRHKIL